MIVVPDGPNPKRPVANDQTLAKVAAYLDQYRLVTCELYVTNPVYRLVEIRATITVEPGSEPASCALRSKMRCWTFTARSTAAKKAQGGISAAQFMSPTHTGKYST